MRIYRIYQMHANLFEASPMLTTDCESSTQLKDRAFFCLNACFTSDHQTVKSFKIRHVKGALIITTIKHNKKVFDSHGS